MIEDEIRLYPCHEEDDVPDGTLHQRWSGYLIDVLGTRYPDGFASGNICVYYERGNTRDYLSPDAFLTEPGVPEPPPRVYRAWRLPSLLFAAEIGSVHNTREKITEKRGRYAVHLQPPELLETDPIDEEKGEVLTQEQLHLFRLTDQGYEEVKRQPNGRLRSAVLDLEIGVDEVDNLRLYTPAGEPLRSHKEEHEARLAAEERANQEAQGRAAAEQRAEQEARDRAAAEQRAREADERAREEASERAAAEERVADERAQREALEREVAELRARLARGDS